MDNATLLTFMGLGLTILFLVLVLALNFKWVLFGTSMAFKRMSTKNNVGLYFLRSKGGNFNPPLLVDLNKKEEEVTIGGKPAVLPITRDDFQSNGLFFGLPYKMANDDDVKTSIGLHYHTTNDKGDPLYNEDGTPIISFVKNSVSVSGGMLKALVDEKAISDALKDFLQKNQIILYLLIGNIVVAAGAAYFGYEMMSNLLPNVESLIKGAITEINNKLDLIIAAVQ